MILSAKDTSIIAMISKFPNLSDDEFDSAINDLDNQEMRKVCMVLVNRASVDTLNEEQREFAYEVAGWHLDGVRTRRTENVERRRSEKEPNKTAQKLLKMRDKGQIDDKVLVLYGISGPILSRPEQTQEDKMELLRQRVRERFGTRWRERLSYPGWLDYGDDAVDMRPDWCREGF